MRSDQAAALLAWRDIGDDRNEAIRLAVGSLEQATNILDVPPATIGGAAAGKNVKVWNAADGKDVLTLPHPSEVHSLAFSADKTRIVTGAADNLARVWEAATAKELQFFSHAGPVRAVLFQNPTTIATGAATLQPKAGEKGKWGYRQALPSGSYRVVAEAEGYRAFKSGRVEVYDGRFTKVDVFLRPLPTHEAPKIIVLIATVKKQPPKGEAELLPGAGVLVRQAGEPLASATKKVTDPGGVARFELKNAGEYDVMASLAGLRPNGKRVRFDKPGEYHVEIILRSSEEPPGPSLARIRLSVVERFPKAKETFTPVPIAGAAIEIRHAGKLVPPPAGKERKSDSLGVYSTEPLESGVTYDLSVSKPGFPSAALEIALGDKDAYRQVELTRGAEPLVHNTFAVRLWIQETATKKPISGALVRVTKGAEAHEAMSKEDGLARFDKLAAGKWSVQVEHRNYYPAADVSLAIDEDGDWNIYLRPRETPLPPPAKTLALRVSVRDRETGAPLAGVQVAIRSRAGEIASGMTRSDGRAIDRASGEEIFRLPAGAYIIEAQRGMEFQPAAKAVRLESTNVAEEILLVRRSGPPPARTLALRVNVRDRETSAPLAGVQVVVRSAGRVVASGTTRSDGRALDVATREDLFHLPMGVYTVEAQRGAEFQPASHTVRLESPETTENILLVRRAGPPPVAKEADLHIHTVALAQITIRHQGMIVAMPPVAQANRDGDFRITLKASPEPYAVHVAKAGFIPEDLSVMMGATDVNRTVMLQPEKKLIPIPTKKVSLTLRIQSREGRPILGATVTLSLGGKMVDSRVLKGVAVYQRADLAPGNYAIRVTAPAYYPFDVNIYIGADLDRSVTLQPSVVIK